MTTPDNSVAWYKETIGEIPASGQDLLDRYSNIPAEDLAQHLFKVRDKAWNIAPYPCIGSWLFLKPSISQSPIYAEILARLKEKDQRLLDLGCCLGQDIRKLVLDGAPAEHIYGLDLEAGLMDAGYDLFRDRGTLRSTFIAADILDDSSSSSPELRGLDGQIDIVFAGSFFHVFDWDAQLRISKRLARLMRKVPGSLVFGHHLGHVAPDTYPLGLGAGSVYAHDEGSLQRMWTQVGLETESKWRVEAELEGTGKPVGFTKEGKWGDPGRRYMRFVVRRE